MNKYRIVYLKDAKVFDIADVLRRRMPTEKQALALMGSMSVNFNVTIEVIERNVVLCSDCGELEATYGYPVQYCVNCRLHHR